MSSGDITFPGGGNRANFRVFGGALYQSPLRFLWHKRLSRQTLMRAKYGNFVASFFIANPVLLLRHHRFIRTKRPFD